VTIVYLRPITQTPTLYTSIIEYDGTIKAGENWCVYCYYIYFLKASILKSAFNKY